MTNTLTGYGICFSTGYGAGTGTLTGYGTCFSIGIPTVFVTGYGTGTPLTKVIVLVTSAPNKCPPRPYAPKPNPEL